MDKELSSTTRSKPRFTGKVRLCIARYRYVHTHSYFPTIQCILFNSEHWAQTQKVQALAEMKLLLFPTCPAKKSFTPEILLVVSFLTGAVCWLRKAPNQSGTAERPKRGSWLAEILYIPLYSKLNWLLSVDKSWTNIAEITCFPSQGFRQRSWRWFSGSISKENDLSAQKIIGILGARICETAPKLSAHTVLSSLILVKNKINKSKLKHKLFFLDIFYSRIGVFSIKHPGVTEYLYE